MVETGPEVRVRVPASHYSWEQIIPFPLVIAPRTPQSLLLLSMAVPMSYAATYGNIYQIKLGLGDYATWLSRCVPDIRALGHLV